MSGAWDLDIRLWRWWDGCGRARGMTGRPGTNSGASPAREPSLAGVVEVSCPPKARCPLTISRDPPRPPPLPPLPFPALPLPRPLLFDVCAGGFVSGVTEAGRNARAGLGASVFVVVDVDVLAPPRCAPLLGPRRWRGARFEAGGAGGSAVDMIADVRAVSIAV